MSLGVEQTLNLACEQLRWQKYNPIYTKSCALVAFLQRSFSLNIQSLIQKVTNLLGSTFFPVFFWSGAYLTYFFFLIWQSGFRNMRRRQIDFVTFLKKYQQTSYATSHSEEVTAYQYKKIIIAWERLIVISIEWALNSQKCKQKTCSYKANNNGIVPWLDTEIFPANCLVNTVNYVKSIKELASNVCAHFLPTWL